MLFEALVAIKLQHMFFGLRKCYLFLVNNEKKSRTESN